MEIKTKKREKCKPLQSNVELGESLLLGYFSTIRNFF